MALKYYLFNRIPGTWKNWTLAVLATSPTDARNYVKARHHGGVMTGEQETGKVEADCGAVTENAEIELSHKFARFMGWEV